MAEITTVQREDCLVRTPPRTTAHGQRQQAPRGRRGDQAELARPTRRARKKQVGKGVVLNDTIDDPPNRDPLELRDFNRVLRCYRPSLFRKLDKHHACLQRGGC
jgi:hypothetical protein